MTWSTFMAWLIGHQWVMTIACGICAGASGYGYGKQSAGRRFDRKVEAVKRLVKQVTNNMEAEAEARQKGCVGRVPRIDEHILNCWRFPKDGDQ